MGVGGSLHNEPYQKRSVMERGCRVSIQPSNDAHTPLLSVKRAGRGVGRGSEHFQAPSHRLRQGFAGCLFLYWEAETHHILSHICSIHLLRDITRVLGLRASLSSPLQLEYQIMNSQFQQEAVRTKCPFKFELITNNLRLDSGEL